jgi:hypothetical protein
MFLILEAPNVTIPLFPILVFGLVFDAVLLLVVIAHIRFVSRLGGQIMALEASTDMMLASQRQLNELVSSLMS